MLDVFKCVFIIIGTIIGAGFASGQEIASFFNRFGDYGLYGIVFACILFGVIIFWILHLIDKRNIASYDDLIGSNKLLRFVQEIFLMVSFCVMIAGIGAFFEEQFDVSSWAGAFVGSTICFLIFSYRHKGLEVLNTVLVPLIVFGIVWISLGKYDANALDEIKFTIQGRFTNNFLFSSILYVGYNSLILIPILGAFKTYSLNNKQKWIIAIISFAFLCFIGVSLFIAINRFYPKIMVFELPTLKLASMLGNITRIMYGIIILFAIFTTAISCGFAFLQFNDKGYMLKSFFMCLTAFLVSNVGFSELVNTVFPIFGYVGIINIFVIICRGKKYNE